MTENARPASHTEPFHMSQIELGIGDIVCSLYAVYGFSVAHGQPPITLHMQDHFEWLDLVAIPGLQVATYDPNDAARMHVRLGDTEAEYREKLRTGIAPKQWYARKLDTTPAVPPLNPALDDAPPDFKRPYVVLAPFATRINRTWGIHNWRIVARELDQAGYEVLALDAPNQPERCKEIGVPYFWGQPPFWVASVCRHAALVIAGDSALAHVGGLLGVDTLVLLTQQIPERYYSMTGNHFLVPQQPCVACRFQPDRGYEERCDFGCWVLQSLSPHTVVAKSRAILEAHATAG